MKAHECQPPFVCNRLASCFGSFTCYHEFVSHTLPRRSRKSLPRRPLPPPRDLHAKSHALARPIVPFVLCPAAVVPFRPYNPSNFERSPSPLPSPPVGARSRSMRAHCEMNFTCIAPIPFYTLNSIDQVFLPRQSNYKPTHTFNQNQLARCSNMHLLFCPYQRPKRIDAQLILTHTILTHYMLTIIVRSTPTHTLRPSTLKKQKKSPILPP